ncbi:MAG TPA: hypothetical protein PK037_02305, partial [Saprospiraceae bacterium]|nr:hypothetical protein [Saprospiraceae bacterium]
MGNYSQQPTSGFKGSKLKSFLVMMNIVLSWSILNAQNVGIGTNNPSAKLHIFGNSITGTQHLKLEENDIDYARLGYYNNGTTNFWETAAFSDETDANSTFNIFNNNTGNLLTIKGNGNIGIGYNFPTFPLNFANKTGGKISFWNSGPNSNYGIGLQDYKLQIHTASSADTMVFGYGSSTNLTELMRIQGNGNVGIGTKNPTYKLDLAGRLRLRQASGTAGIYFDGITLPTRSFIGTLDDDHVGLFGSVVGWNFLMNVNNGNVGIGESAPAYKLDLKGRLRIQHSPGASSGLVLDGPTQAIRSFIGTMNDDYIGMYGYGGIGWNFVMNTQNGNIGIGTTTPASKLDIEGGISIGASFAGSAAAPENGAIIEGNLGLGTSTPLYPLNFANTTGQKISFWNTSPTSNYGIGLQDFKLQIHGSTALDNVVFGYGSSSNLTETMRIQGDGKVGIGTQTPASKLDVNGGISVGASYAGITAAPANGALIEGNVGIGTTAPVYKLDVAGRLRLKHSTGTAGIYFDGVTMPTRSFIGTYDDNHLGLFGSGSGWSFSMNVNNGNIGLGTMAPTTKLEVNGYTKLGSDAPAIKIKKLTGTMP